MAHRVARGEQARSQQPMPAISPCELPADAFLSRYRASGAYADCYVTEVTATVSHAQFVEAFYTTAVFRLERLILSVFASRRSTDSEAGQLARGEAASFAAWTVEQRAADQLLLADFTGRTRSWLAVRPAPGGGTRLYFGSAVVPVRDRKTGRLGLGRTFDALLGFHKVYSRVLLSSAGRRVRVRAQRR